MCFPHGFTAHETWQNAIQALQNTQSLRLNSRMQELGTKVVRVILSSHNTVCKWIILGSTELPHQLSPINTEPHDNEDAWVLSILRENPHICNSGSGSFLYGVSIFTRWSVNRSDIHCQGQAGSIATLHNINLCEGHVHSAWLHDRIVHHKLTAIGWKHVAQTLEQKIHLT